MISRFQCKKSHQKIAILAVGIGFVSVTGVKEQYVSRLGSQGLPVDFDDKTARYNIPNGVVGFGFAF